MARAFVAASSQYLERTSAVIAAVPMTVSLWFQTPAVTTYRTLLSLGSSLNGTNYWVLQTRGDLVGDPLEWVISTTGGATGVQTTTPVVAGQWMHGIGLSASATDHRIYLNAGGGGSSSVSRVPAGVNRTTLGVFHGGTIFDGYHDGLIAEVGIWSAALDDGERAALARGISPRRVRPGSLVAYWPLYGLHSPEIDLAAGLYPLTVTGTTAANHSPVGMQRTRVSLFDLGASEQSFSAGLPAVGVFGLALTPERFASWSLGLAGSAGLSLLAERAFSGSIGPAAVSAALDLTPVRTFAGTLGAAAGLGLALTPKRFASGSIDVGAALGLAGTREVAFAGSVTAVAGLTLDMEIEEPGTQSFSGSLLAVVGRGLDLTVGRPFSGALGGAAAFGLALTLERQAVAALATTAVASLSLVRDLGAVLPIPVAAAFGLSLQVVGARHGPATFASTARRIGPDPRRATILRGA